MADESSSKQTERKVRFRPKIPPRREPKAAEPKIEAHPDAEAAKTCAPSDGPIPKASYTNRNEEYVDPLDMSSNYPVRLPQKRPNSGDPELNKNFEKAADLEYDETKMNAADTTIPKKMNAAEELGLMEESEEPRVLHFQLPSLPVVKRSASAIRNEVVDGLTPSRNMGSPEKGCSLEELPAGHVGKIQVYKSGAIKMKIGEIPFDVNPGSSDSILHVTAINTQEMHHCNIGMAKKNAVVTPNIDSLLDKSKESGD